MRLPLLAVLAGALALLTALPAAAQIDVRWRTSTEGASTVATAPDGSVFVGGGSSTAPTVTRLSPIGAVVWTATLPTNSIRDIVLGTGGEVYALTSVSAGFDIAVHRVNADGTVAWSRTYDGPNSGGTFQEVDSPKAILLTSTGTVVTVSETGFAAVAGKAIWTQGHALDGTLLWSRTSVQGGDEFPSATRAAVDCAGNVFIVGNLSRNGNTNAPGVLLSYTSSGTERLSARLFSSVVAGPQAETSRVGLNEVAVDCATGAVYVAGVDDSNVANTSGGRDINLDVLVARFDGTSASPTWRVEPFTGFSGSGGGAAVSNLAVGGPDAIYATAQAGESPTSPNRVEAVRLAPDGAVAWRQTLTGNTIGVYRPTVASAEGVVFATYFSFPTTVRYQGYSPAGVLQWTLDRTNQDVGSPINREESMATHPEGGVVWVEGFQGGVAHVVRAGPPPGPARVQIVHGSAAMDFLGPIQLYVNQPATSTTPDATVSFRGGSQYLTVPSGAAISVRARLQNAPPIPDFPREYTFTVPPVAPGRYVVSLAGIPQQLISQYAPNPQGISLLLSLIALSIANNTPLDGGGVAVAVTNTITDAPAVDVVVTGTGQMLADDLPYGQASTPRTLAPGAYRAEVRRAADQSVLGVVRFTLSGTESVFPLLLSGFVTPSANRNGPAVAVTATDATGAVVGGVVATDDETTAGHDLTVANPTRAGATVRFAVEAASAVRVAVYDVLGREVAVLAEGERAAGAYTAALPSTLAPGAYVVRLRTAAGTVTRRATIVR